MVTIFLLILGCGETLAEREKRCAPVLQKLLIIQTQRNTAMDRMQQYSADHKAEKIDRQTHLEHYMDWRDAEEGMSAEANLIYQDAEKSGCL